MEAGADKCCQQEGSFQDLECGWQGDDFPVIVRREHLIMSSKGC